MTANADGLRQRLSTYAGALVTQGIDLCVERMRTEAPIAQAGSPDTGGSLTRGELRRSLRAGPTQLGFDRSTAEFQAPVIQANTTEFGAVGHFITARKRGGVLVFYSRNAGAVVTVWPSKANGGFARVWHPGSQGTHWAQLGLQRWWPVSLAEASHNVTF